MLIGEYSLSLSEKNRIALPKKLKEQLTTELIVTRGYEGCAILLDKKRWQSLVASIDENSLFRLTVRDTKRYLLGGAMGVELDKQGRFVLPGYILEHIALKTKDMVIVGVGQWLELWDKEVWGEKANYLRENAADIAERLATTKIIT